VTQPIIIRPFVSSTWLDLRPERNAVETLLQRFRETKYIGMEHFGSRAETTLQTSLTEVDRSDLYIGIIGGRYGSGITEAEYDEARGRNLPCLIYFKQETAIQPEGRDSESGKAECLEKFKKKLRDPLHGHTVTEFSGSLELASRLASDLHNWLFDRYLAPALSDASRGDLPAEQATALGDDLRHLAALDREMSAKVAEEKRIVREAFHYLTYNVPKIMEGYPGSAPDRESIVRYNLGQLDRLCILNAREAYVLRELATNHRLLASILIEQKDLLRALEAFKTSANYCAKLIILQPEEAFYHRDLAVSRLNAGTLPEEQKDYSGATQEYRAAAESAKRAAELDSQWAELADDAGGRVKRLKTILRSRKQRR
jgi:Domain of unknown function (DUF4062)